MTTERTHPPRPCVCGHGTATAVLVEDRERSTAKTGTQGGKFDGCADTCVVMDYDGYSEFTRETFPRARKPYRCTECGAAIPVGAVHQSLVGKCDGDLWSARTCAPCAEIRKTFVCDSYVIDTLWEEITEQLFREWNDMLAIDCLAKLSTQPAIDKMREKYAEYREDSDNGSPEAARCSRCGQEKDSPIHGAEPHHAYCPEPAEAAPPRATTPEPNGCDCAGVGKCKPEATPEPISDEQVARWKVMSWGHYNAPVARMLDEIIRLRAYAETLTYLVEEWKRAAELRAPLASSPSQATGEAGTQLSRGSR